MVALDQGDAQAAGIYAPGGKATEKLVSRQVLEALSQMGGDLDRSEAMFRKGLELDPRERPDRDALHLRNGLPNFSKETLLVLFGQGRPGFRAQHTR